jgi:hypothetical protein
LLTRAETLASLRIGETELFTRDDAAVRDAVTRETETRQAAVQEAVARQTTAGQVEVRDLAARQAAALETAKQKNAAREAAEREKATKGEAPLSEVLDQALPKPLVLRRLRARNLPIGWRRTRSADVGRRFETIRTCS